MRYSYIMRNSARSSLKLLVAAAALVVAPAAFAQDGGAGAGGAAGAGGSGGGTPQPKCDPGTLLCSSAQFPQKAESMDRLPGDIDTGWLPECDPPAPHCGSIQFRAQIAFDPVKSGGPLYTVDMTKGTMVDARWPTTDWIDLTLPPGSPTDGSFKVAHTMTPEIGLYIDVLSFTTEIILDASTIINYLPGAQFNYIAMNSTKFKPYGFDSVALNVNGGGNLASSVVIAVTFDQLGKLVGTGGFEDYITGSFSFNAITNSDFTYQTTKVVVTGATGPINYADGMAQVMSPDGDYLEFIAHTEGIMRYTGTIELLPVINISSVGGFGITLNFPISVGLEFDYGQGSIPVVFPNQVVHLPLPNVFVPSTTLNFGEVDTGGKSEAKTVTIENTGELGALYEFSSDNTQFKVHTVSGQAGPDGAEFDLKVTFQPTKSGAQTGVITVKSNDPDSPVQTFNVQGFGRGEDIPDPEDAGTGGSGGGAGDAAGINSTPYEAGDDGGCGCRTPSGNGNAAGASLALLGLALAFLRRRRG